MSDIYGKWYYRSNPFAQTPLPPSDEGLKLLVGRDEELRRIRTLISAPPKFVTVEGRNGIGKTSIINVAAYTCQQDYLQGNNGAPPLITCGEPFQLAPDVDQDTFVLRVFHQVIIALSVVEDQLKLNGRQSDILEPLAKWLQDPIITGNNLGASAVGFGLTVGRAQAANSGDGFKSSGFEVRAKHIRNRSPLLN